MTVLAVRVPAGAAEAGYSLGELARLLRCDTRPVEDGEVAHIAYGEAGEALCRIPSGPAGDWDDPRPALAWDGGLPLVHRGELVRARSADGPGFDLLYATYAALTGPWERADARDEAGCPIASDSWLARHGLLGIPLVHRYAALLREALTERGVDLPVPRSGPIVVTHDVDTNFGHLFARRERLALLRHDLRARRGAAARRALGLLREVLRGRSVADPNDRWDEWDGLHRGWGGRPAYFVAPFGLFRPGAQRQDVPYDVRHPEVAATLRRLAGEGAELGLHLSLQARQSPDQVARERTALEEAAGVPVRSARHHWWSMDSPPERTLRAHEAAGLVLDLSFGFNDRIGFRRGIAAPFHPFDHDSRRPLGLLCLPTLAMDAALYGPGRDEEAALAELESLRGTVADAGGVLVLDWHAHSANPAALPGAADGLRRFLASARAHGATVATPLEALERWGDG